MVNTHGIYQAHKIINQVESNQSCCWYFLSLNTTMYYNKQFNDYATKKAKWQSKQYPSR